MDLGNPRPPNLPSARPNSSNEVYWKKVGLLMIFQRAFEKIISIISARYLSKSSTLYKRRHFCFLFYTLQVTNTESPRSIRQKFARQKHAHCVKTILRITINSVSYKIISFCSIFATSKNYLFIYKHCAILKVLAWLATRV